MSTVVENLRQMLKGGDVILCSFLVLQPSIAKNQSKDIFNTPQLVAIIEIILYALFKSKSNDACNFPFVVVVSVLCVVASIFVSYIRLEEKQSTEGTKELIKNSNEVSK